MFSIHTPLKTPGFLMFSEGIKWNYWQEMIYGKKITSTLCTILERKNFVCAKKCSL